MPPEMADSLNVRHSAAFASARAVVRQLVIGLAVVLAVLLSGVPRGAALIVNGDKEHCFTPCTSGDDDGDCSPVCTTGQCAKVLAATPAATALVAFEFRGSEIIPTQELAPVEQPGSAAVGVVSGIFHPPRA